jgi:hypothetical protein
MNISTYSTPILSRKRPTSLMIRTTLYDLISAIRDVVDMDADDLVVVCVMHILTTHQLTCLGTALRRRLVSGEDREPRRGRHSMATPVCSARSPLRSRRALPPQSYTSSRHLPSIYPRQPPATA